MRSKGRSRWGSSSSKRAWDAPRRQSWRSWWAWCASGSVRSRRSGWRSWCSVCRRRALVRSSAARSRRLPMASSTACRPPSMIPRASRRSRPRSRRWGIRSAEKAVILGALPLGVTGNTPDSGSGESWFEPRRGNSKRDATMSRVALSSLSRYYRVPMRPRLSIFAITFLAACGGGGEGPAQPGPPDHLLFLSQPGPTPSNQPITLAVQVAIVDASGATVTTATSPVSLALGTNLGGGTLSGTPAVNAVGGVATFANVAIDVMDPVYTIAATSGTLGGATSTSFPIVRAFASVSAGGYSGLPYGFACGLTPTAAAYCWGYNLDGELGIGSTSGPQLCATYPCSMTP